MKKNQNGITLIALVVTIIVILILAGITIQVVLQGGIFDQANKASESYKIADLRENRYYQNGMDSRQGSRSKFANY